jgi:HEAT repeat protein
MWYEKTANASALGTMKSEEAVISLGEALKDEDERVRRAVVLALMEIHTENTIPPLAEALMDKDWEVRLYALNALKKIGTPEALKIIKNYESK